MKYNNIFIAQNTKRLKVLDLVENVKDSDTPVLIAGETGTGKEVIAAYIQHLVYRFHKKYELVNNLKKY